MGLLDDGAKLRRELAEQQAEQEANEKARKVPFAADWSRELAALLLQHGVAPLPVYIKDERNERERERDHEPVSTYTHPREIHHLSHWGEAWPLIGVGKRDIDGDAARVPVILDRQGQLWSCSGGPQTASLVDGVWVEASRGVGLRVYPDVRLDSRGTLFLADTPRSVRDYMGSECEKLRDYVGVPIAAALLAGPVPDDDWISGVG